MGINSGSKNSGGSKGGSRPSGRIRRNLATPPSKPYFHPDIENPFPEKKEFRLGIFQILEEKDDYLICRGFDPNEKNPFSEITPSALRTIEVAKPPLLQRTAWEDPEQAFEIGGRTYTFEYSDEEYGVRTATDDEGGSEEQRIDMPYFVDDFIVAVEIRQKQQVDGIDADNEDGARLSWMDLNVSGRHWTSTGGLLLGKYGSDVSKGNSATFTLYNPLTDTAYSPARTITALVRLGDYTANKWAYIGDVDGNKEVINTECG